MPKVLTIPFMVQVIILQAFAPKGFVTEATNALLICPVPTSCIYIERSSHYLIRGHTKDLPVLKQRLSHYIVEVIALAYTS